MPVVHLADLEHIDGFLMQPFLREWRRGANRELALLNLAIDSKARACDLSGFGLRTSGQVVRSGTASPSSIATDSLEQTRSCSSPFFLDGTGHELRMPDLSAIIAGKEIGRTSPEETTLFCSVGLAGTEVAIASAIFDSIAATNSR